MLTIFLCCLGNITSVRMFRGQFSPKVYFIQIVTFLESFWIQHYLLTCTVFCSILHPCEFPQILVKWLWKAWALHKLSCFLRAQFPGPGLCPWREEAIKCFIFLVKVTEVNSIKNNQFHKVNLFNTKLCFKCTVGEKFFLLKDLSIWIYQLFLKCTIISFVYVIPDFKELGEVNLQNQIIGQYIKMDDRASLVAQWLRIRLPMQGTRVWALVWEDPTCCGTAKPVRHNYWPVL